DVLFANNLFDGFLWARDGATGAEQNNLIVADAAMFVDALAGDLHLSASATDAIDQGATLADVVDDWDGALRVEPQDIGADEYQPPVEVMTMTMTMALAAVAPSL